MKLPQGYKDAYERTRETAGLKSQEKKKMNMLDDEDFDSDIDSDIEQVPGRMCALRSTEMLKTATPTPPAPHPLGPHPTPRAGLREDHTL